LRHKNNSQRLSLLEIDMQLKLKLTVVAAIAAVAGVASAQEQVVKIGHVAPIPAPRPTTARTTKTAPAWPLKT
jgi:hypothetical protein